MWVLRWIVGTLAVLLIIAFAIQNTDINVVIKFYKWQSLQLPLWVVMYISFAAGILTWLLISIVRVIGLRQEIRKARRENKKLRDELNRMRNVAIDVDEQKPALPAPSSTQQSIKSPETPKSE